MARIVALLAPAVLSPSCVNAELTKYLLLDDRNVISTDGAQFALGTMTKHPGGALIKEEREYEMRFDNMQPSVWFDSATNKWRAWYSAFTNCSVPKNESNLCNNAPAKCDVPMPIQGAKRDSAVLYAESHDGITWTKPDLGLVEWNGNKNNNIIRSNELATGVYLDERANASERWKFAVGCNGGNSGCIAVSADGLTYTKGRGLGQGEVKGGRYDTPRNVVWDPVKRQYVMYIRNIPTSPHIIRMDGYTHTLTDDYMGKWSPAYPTGLNTSKYYQPDGLVVFPYEGIYLGIGNVFNPGNHWLQQDERLQDPPPSGGPARVGQVNMVLAWSPDGRTWKWLSQDSILPLGKDGDFDACGVFGGVQDPLRSAGNSSTLRYYYVGCNGPFFGSRGCGLGMATLQRDGWAGYKGKGTVITAPVRVAAPILRVSVNGGNTTGVRVGITGDSKRTVENCIPILGEQTDVAVTWKDVSDVKQFVNGAISLEFSIPVDGMAFAYTFTDASVTAVGDELNVVV